MDNQSYDIESYREMEERNDYTPMYKDSFSSRRVYDNSNQVILPPVKLRNSAEKKNKKLVSLLKQKIFKGFEKIKSKNIVEDIPETTILRVNSMKFKVKWKNLKQIKKKIEKDRPPLSITNFNSTYKFDKVETDEDKLLFITEKPKIENRSRKRNKETSMEKYLREIFNNNIEEAKFFNLLNFKPFDIKRPNMKTHYNNLNKRRLESELLDDMGNKEEEMAKTSKSDFLFKISRPKVEIDKTKKINFMTNPGLIKGKLVNSTINEISELPSINKSTEKNVGTSPRYYNDTHTDKIKKLAHERECLSKHKSIEKVRNKLYEKKELAILRELNKDNETSIDRNINSEGDNSFSHMRIKNKSLNTHFDNFKREYKWKANSRYEIGSNLKKTIIENNKRFKNLKDLVMGSNLNNVKAQTYNDSRGRDLNVFKILKMVNQKKQN